MDASPEGEEWECAFRKGVEVEPEARAPVIKAYLDRAVGARPHIPVDHSAPVEAFEPIATAYPVFRIEG